VNPPGGEAPAAQLLVDALARVGVESQLVPTPSPQGGPLRAAAIARVRGRRERPALLLLSHLDVVDARSSEWSDDPFAGTIRDGFVIGRGALDSKGLAVVHALALEALARRDRPLRRDVLLLSVPDEEAGGRHGLAWILRERAKLLADVRHALGEGGSIREIPSQRPVWSVSVSEKSPCWLELRTHGTPGHSASPSRDAAVPRLIAALERVRTMDWPVQVVPEVARMFRSLAPVAAPADRAAYEDLAHALDRDPEFRRRFLRHDSNASLVRTTVAITVLEGAPSTNVLPAQARAQLDARLLPGQDCDGFERKVRARIADPGVEMVRLLGFRSESSPVATPLFRAIEATAREVEPGSLVVARMSAGSSDAHWLRERGIVTYGFVPRWLPDDEARRVHGPDERISIRNLERGAETLVRLIERFDELDR
jgi:acetylornithine deacetylase/succinyl-diaminopimelate desuccinylase-like protein